VVMSAKQRTQMKENNDRLAREKDDLAALKELRDTIHKKASEALWVLMSPGGVPKDDKYSKRATSEKAQRPAASDFRHSEDYMVVTIHGQEFRLTSVQAQVIELLHQAYEKGQPDLGSALILEKIERKSSRLRDIFRSRPSAWKALVRITGRGLVRLNL